MFLEVLMIRYTDILPNLFIYCQTLYFHDLFKVRFQFLNWISIFTYNSSTIHNFCLFK